MRPLVAIPARFAATTSALRYAAEVNARALLDAVWRAGGEPVSLHPHAPGGTADPAALADRLARFDAVLLPGGGDLSPARYTDEPVHAGVYDMDAEQDGFDLELARQAVALGLPLLAVCRGLQVLNVALGGTLEQDMGDPGHHRHLRHRVTPAPGGPLAAALGTAGLDASCYHHQRVARLGAGLRPAARAADGTVEALELPAATGWLTAVQWHPEDTADRDPRQQALFDALVEQARAEN
ncbi:gamma-glutamyl-gamma-aminobutyrate hydrolase family protein [Kitasatospora sp. NPDC056446]|uniref:gamma-glutamyl-gamma-aminobutyrate hydrolase family protein n=1 Tax=Kitasatospora sp. NPDC056446 TaxID=3345819 RepID=UPI003689F19D